MPVTKFICPDNEEILVGDCLAHCRLGKRCLTLPTLVLIISTERPWTGQPTTTSLLNGTLQEFLKATQEYAINPRERAFALLGSNHHDRLARISGDFIAESTVGGHNGPKGTPDLLEPDEDFPGSYLLTDYKTYGSFRVQKMLGLVKHSEFHPTEVYLRGGKWGAKGSPKKITTWEVNPSKIDISDEALQLNHYRVLAKQEGFNVSRMQLQVTVRDGGLQIARERGITEQVYLVDVPWIEDQQILEFFNTKYQMLKNAVEQHLQPSPCTDTESWSKRKCDGYCDVAKFCPQGQQIAVSKGGGV